MVKVNKPRKKSRFINSKSQLYIRIKKNEGEFNLKLLKFIGWLIEFT